MRTKRPFALAALIAFTLAPPILAQDSVLARESLRGLPAAVFVLIENPPPELESDGLFRAQLQTDVELKLRLAGIKVLTREQHLVQDEDGRPYLYLSINSVKRQSGFYSLCIDISLMQDVRLVRNFQLVYGVSTWSKGSVMTVGENRLRQAVRDDVKDRVDEFINAYLSVNPKSP